MADPIVLTTDRATLALEDKGYELGTLLDGSSATDNAAFAKGKRFATVIARRAYNPRPWAS